MISTCQQWLTGSQRDALGVCSISTARCCASSNCTAARSQGFHTMPPTLHGTLRGLIMNCRPHLESQWVFIYSSEGVWDSVTGRQVWWWGVWFTSNYWTDLLINPTGQQAPSCPSVLPGWLSDSYRVAIVSCFHWQLNFKAAKHTSHRKLKVQPWSYPKLQWTNISSEISTEHYLQRL